MMSRELPKQYGVVMKRILLATAVLSVLVIPVPFAGAAPSRTEVPPIALNGEDGTLSVFVYLGPSSEISSVPMMGTLPVKVCDGSDCATYTGNYLSDNEGYSMHRYISTQISIGERFSKKVVTAQVPSDLVDGSKGWSAASNEVTGWSDSVAWFKSRESRPVLEVQYKAIDKTSITRADLCSNYRAGDTVAKSVGGSFSLTGYTSLKYVLLENGTQIKSEDLSSVLPGMSSVPACGGGTMGTSVMKNIDGLTAGRSYKLSYTISGPSKPDVVATLDFVAPGACPSGEIVLPASPRSFYYGVIGTDGYLKSYLATGTYPWRLDSIIGSRLAPIYFSASKIGPYKGNLYGVRDSGEKWRYVKEIDDWALAVDNATPVSAANLLEYTVFAGCTSTSLKPTLTLDESTVKASDQGCVIDGNEVVPTKAGQCIVKAQVPTSGVGVSSIRKRASSTTVTMNYVFNSVGSFTRSTSTTIQSASPCAISLSSTKRTASSTSLLRCVGLTKKTGQTVALVVASSSARVCRVSGLTLVRKAKGTCKVTVRLKKGTKLLSNKSLTLSVK